MNILQAVSLYGNNTYLRKCSSIALLLGVTATCNQLNLDDLDIRRFVQKWAIPNTESEGLLTLYFFRLYH